jgi:UDP-N-acetylglucosamine 2-epimerase (non-hydrolysing)
MARVGVVLGTRPEVVKLAPVVLALRAHPDHEPVVISTGQHRDLLEPLLTLFGLAADVDLDLMVPGQSLTDLAGAAVRRVGAALDELDLDALVVQGDTTTTLAGALAGFYARVPVVHVEAGLRTDDRLAPYPEEVNRRVVTQLADLHLAPTATAAARLLAEGVDPERVVTTGNTVVDALLATLERGLPYTGPDAARLAAAEAADGPLLLVTAHRRESWDGGIAAIAAAVADLVAAHPDLTVVFPVHPNPVVRSAVLPALGALSRVVLTEPLGYADFVRLLRHSDVVLTDSGGIQEEACSLGVPTLVARDTTERPEGAGAGGLLLVGTDRDRIVSAADRLLRDRAAYDALRCTTMPFGDGHAAGRVVDALDLVLAPAVDRSRTA